MSDNKEKLKSFWFYISDDYRSGRSICTYTNLPNNDEDNDDNNNTPEEACEIEFALPKEGIRLYIVNDFPHYEPIWYKDINDDEDNDDNNNIESSYLKIFSQIHDCLPFEVTGYNCAYKEEGYYPDVSEDIKNMPDIIDEDLTEKIGECYDDGYYFIFIVDCDGNEIKTELLNPI